jgi:hypothetical protein
MGKCDTASAHIGIKIALSDLIPQINETNFELIKEILRGGFISDYNDSYNETYMEIIHNRRKHPLPENYLEFKSCLEEKFKTTGEYVQYKDGRSEHSLYHGCLFEKELLHPIKHILSNERWGYDRYGINGSSRPMDFDLSVDTEKYRDIQNYTIVFIVQQYAC